MIKLENIDVTFTQGKKVVKAVRNVSVNVEDGDIYGIIGYSGAGKSTLVRTINLLQRPTSGNVEVVNDIKGSLEGYDVLVVDDITDSALTMDHVLRHLKGKNPKSIKSCVLLDKPSRRKVELVPDYCGFTIEDKFVVGYGLNYGDHYRNIPYVFVVTDKDR